MKIIASVLLLCFSVAIEANPRIIGGSDSPDGKYPYMVSLRNLGRHFCGGSILNERWILTAAHCLVGYPNSKYITAHVGSNKLSGASVQVYQAEYTTYHDDYDAGLITSDVGLVRVNKDIVFNSKVQPIVLTDDDQLDPGTTAVLSGWGRTATSGTANYLQEINLKIVSQEVCNETWAVVKPPITRSYICTQAQMGEGACYGDSGSPLVIKGVQIGIASFVVPCARGAPYVFTRVYTFLDWIKEEQEKYD